MTSSAPLASPGKKVLEQNTVVSRALLRETNHPDARAWDWAVCWPPAWYSRLPGQAWPSALGQVLWWWQHPRGAAPPHLHPQRTHPLMLRSTSYPRMAHRMKCWASCGTNQRNHPGIGWDIRCVRSKRSVGTYRRRGSYCDPQICALSVEVPRGIAAERDSADCTVTPARNKTRWKALWRSAHFSATRLQSKNLMSGCTCRPFIPVSTGSGSGLQNPLANFTGVRDDCGFQVNPLCHHDITRSDRQIGNLNYCLNISY